MMQAVKPYQRKPINPGKRLGFGGLGYAVRLLPTGTLGKPPVRQGCNTAVAIPH